MKPLLTDEIVFENRNQNYGAFELRKRYNRSLFVSLIISLVIFGVVVLISVVSSTNIDDEFYDFNNVVFEYTDLQYAPDEPPRAPDNPKPPDKQEPAKTENLNEVKLVNDSATVTDTNLLKDKSLAEGDSLNSGANGNGADTGLVFTGIQEVPMFPGGEAARKKFIQEHINYANLGSNVKIEGVVWVTFKVEADGSLSNIKLLNGIGATCDNEVINMVKLMPKWIPGKRNGHPCPMIYKMPIRFGKSI